MFSDVSTFTGSCRGTGFHLVRTPESIIGLAELIGLIERSGDYVAAAGPLAQVNQPAALAAEGELWFLL
jgi:hypothetical protein